MKNIAFITTIAAFILVVTNINAQTNTPHIDQRQIKQQTRINQGIANGSIKPAEQVRLQRLQSKISFDKEIAKADGVVTKSERKALVREQHHASHKITRSKHNHHKQHAKKH
jgi:hypothetical protein